MTTIATRVRAISDLEGFDIIVRNKSTGKEMKPSANGVLGPYPYEKKLKGAKTVADWKRDRFEAAYPGFTCDILNGEGGVVPPQTTLRVARETYEED
jgi:hypothetical protein